MRWHHCVIIGVAFAAAYPSMAAAGDIALKPGAFEAPVSAARIGRAWAADGFSCAATNLTAEYDVTRVNIIDERIAVVRGGLDVTVAGRTYNLSAGDAIHLPVGTKRRQTTGERSLSTIAFGYGPYDTPTDRCG